MEIARGNVTCLSIPEYLSRYQACKKGYLTGLPRPAKSHFLTDLKSIPKSFDHMQVLEKAIAITDAYIWPTSTFTLVLNEGGKINVHGQKALSDMTPYDEVDDAVVPSLSREDLGIDDRNSLYNAVRSLTYVPRTDFPEGFALYFLEGDILKRVVPQKTFPVDCSSIVSRVSKHSKKMIIFPLRTPYKNFGMAILTFKDALPWEGEYFSDPSGGGYGGQGMLEYMRWFRMLQGSMTEALEKLSS